VIFLNIGGEGPITSQWVCWENYTYMEQAKSHSALIIQLEHRFFEGTGKSGLGDMTTANLAYLTTELALADINRFIQEYSKQRKWTNPIWIGFGGSYPGSLAAYMRKFYPNATAGNVASSAPLTPAVNFYEYASVMEKTIQVTSQDCYDAVKQAFNDVQAKVDANTNAARAEVVNTFHINNGDLTQLLDRQTFYGALFEVFQDVIQYTYDARNYNNLNGLDITHACNLMTDKSKGTPMQRLYQLYVWDNSFQNATSPLKTMDISYADSILPLQQTALTAPQAAMRGWMWLSCNEFGWLQTTDDGTGFWGNYQMPLSYYMRMCSDLFNQTFTTNGDTIQDHVARSQTYFGIASTYNATNVVLPNGELDPWHSLGSYVTIESQHQTPVLTPGAAHCSDMYPAYANEPVGLKHTRSVVVDQVNYFITQQGGDSGNKGAASISLSIATVLTAGVTLIFASA
jgi:hypothetical protein